MDFSFSWDSMFGSGGDDNAGTGIMDSLHKDDFNFDDSNSYDPMKSSLLQDNNNLSMPSSIGSDGSLDLSTFNAGTQGSFGNNSGFLGSTVPRTEGEDPSKSTSGAGDFSKMWEKMNKNKDDDNRMLDSSVSHNRLSSIQSGDVQALPDQASLVKLPSQQWKGGPFASAFNNSSLFK